MDRSATRSSAEPGRHRTAIIVVAVAAIALLALAWLLAAPAVGIA